MSTRDELSAVIADALTRPHEGEPALDSLRAAARVLAAGYRKSRTVTAEVELDALPDGVIILTEQGGIWESIKRHDGLNWWKEPGAKSSVSASYDLTLPATVLYEPAP